MSLLPCVANLSVVYIACKIERFVSIILNEDYYYYYYYLGVVFAMLRFLQVLCILLTTSCQSEIKRKYIHTDIHAGINYDEKQTKLKCVLQEVEPAQCDEFELPGSKIKGQAQVRPLFFDLSNQLKIRYHDKTESKSSRRRHFSYPKIRKQSVGQRLRSNHPESRILAFNKTWVAVDAKLNRLSISSRTP